MSRPGYYWENRDRINAERRRKYAARPDTGHRKTAGQRFPKRAIRRHVERARACPIRSWAVPVPGPWRPRVVMGCLV